MLGEKKTKTRRSGRMPMPRMAAALAAAVLPTLPACSPGKLSGEIDGEGVPGLASVVYATVEIDDREALLLLGTSFFASCEQLAEDYERRYEANAEDSDSDVADGLAAADVELGVPDNAWRLAWIRVDEDPIHDGDSVDVLSIGDNGSLLSLEHQQGPVDYDRVVDGKADHSLEQYVGYRGRLSISEYDASGSLRLTGQSVDFVDQDDAFDDDARVQGQLTLDIQATYCDALASTLDDIFSDDKSNLRPVPGNGETEDPEELEEPEDTRAQCITADDCANIVCYCDNNTALGMPVNTSACINGRCEVPSEQCPETCSNFGYTWTGDADVIERDADTPDPEEPIDNGETGTCSGLLGVDDGCDCGCGVFDTDCASISADVCEYDNCQVGEANPNDNRFCID